MLKKIKVFHDKPIPVNTDSYERTVILDNLNQMNKQFKNN